MIKRKALLIGCPQTKGGSNLPGTEADVESYRSYFYSIKGGAWDFEEVDVLVNPTRRQLQAQLSTYPALDYFLLTFSGHGAHDPNADISYVCTSDGEDYLVKDLYIKVCRKQQLIIDSCRAFHLTDRALILKKALEESLARSPSASERLEARKMYDGQIDVAEYGREAMYSCSPKESADEDQSGGLFTRKLIEAGRIIQKSVVTTKDAFDVAKINTTAKNMEQNPTMKVPRRIHWYPFAVNP